MEITFDKSADAVYLRFGKGKFAKNRKVDDSTILDLDAKDHLLGIELLNASKRLNVKSLLNVRVKNLAAANE